MNCPFRVNQKVRRSYDYSSKKEYDCIEQYYPECDQGKCPYYDYDKQDGEVCMRVAAEIVKCRIGGFEDDE